MIWRQRRRVSLANLISYVYTFLGVVFILGNVFMLRAGFVELYVSMFGGGGRGEKSRLVPAGKTLLHHTRHELSWRQLAGQTFLDLPAVELPSRDILMELKSRDQMENLYRSGDVQSFRQDVIIPQPQSEVSWLTSRDLRRYLSTSSDCHWLRNVSGTTLIGWGWTKAVYRTTYRGRQVALKTVDTSGHDVTTCRKDNPTWGVALCYEKTAQKIFKEIVLLRKLQHPTIIKVIAHCVPENYYDDTDDDVVSVVTELGENVDVISLLTMSWEDRLRISYDLTKLLHYLSHSPYGPLLLADFRRQQFVLVRDSLKISDLDDVIFSERRCLTDGDCRHYDNVSDFTLSAQCINRQCHGLNEKLNVYNAGRHFTTFLLPHGAPRSLRPEIDRLVDNYNSASLPVLDLLKGLTRIVDSYASGWYLDPPANRTARNYTAVPETDIPGYHDYHCRYTMATDDCTVSVYDILEAQQLCDNDVLCKGFIVTQKTTWTGRMLVHLKDGCGGRVRNKKTTLYVRHGC